MNSINKNQPEENHEDLIGEAAVEKIKALTEKASVCFFCTKIETGESFSSRPMTVQKVDEQGNIFFLSASDSSHNGEITEDPYVQLLSQGSDYSDFLNIYGIATVSTDKAVIKELWKPMFKTWFTEGEDDPRITVIKIKPLEGYYWDTKHGVAVSFVKRLIGAAVGKTMDDSIEGKINV
jgi:general stress protein 26